MSDFIIVLSVAILGLLAQAAGGKRVKKLVAVLPATLSKPEVSQQTPLGSNLAAGKADSAGGHSNPEGGLPSSAQANEETNSVVDVKSAINSSVAEPAEAGAPAPGESASAEALKQSGVATADTAEGGTPPEPPLSALDSGGSEDPAAQIVEAPLEVQAEAAIEDGSAAEKLVEASTPDLDKVAEIVESATDEATEKAVEHATDEASEKVAELVAEETIEKATGEAPEKVAEASPTVAQPPVMQASAEPVAAEQPAGVAANKVESAPVVTPPVMREEFAFNRKPAIEWFLRVTIFLWFIGLAGYYSLSTSGLGSGDLPTPDPWVMQVTFVTCALTGLGLVKGFRTILSYCLSAVDCIFDIKVLKAMAKNWTSLKPAFAADRVFVPASIPHMVGLFIYVQTMYYLLASMAPKTDFQMPGMPIPMPLPLDQLFSYNGLGLVMLSFCGCGIFVTRSFKDVLQRLALVRPTPPQIMIGLGLVFMSFMYDFLWAFYTHGQHLGLDTKLAGYNGGTFTASGGFTGALILALATAVFAGVGEETLIRGALQPVFGLVPAAILHGVLHAQFQHAPIFIIQVAGWSILMGIVKRYTNTSTTIIGHAGFNFVTTFLFAYNPPDIL